MKYLFFTLFVAFFLTAAEVLAADSVVVTTTEAISFSASIRAIPLTGNTYCAFVANEGVYFYRTSDGRLNSRYNASLCGWFAPLTIDSNHILVADSARHNLLLIDAQGKEKKKIGFSATILGLSVDSSGTRLAVYTSDSTLRIYSLPDYQEYYTTSLNLPRVEYLVFCSWSTQGDRVVVRTEAQSFHSALVDITKKKIIQSHILKDSTHRFTAWSHDLRSCLSFDADTVSRWSLDSVVSLQWKKTYPSLFVTGEWSGIDDSYILISPQQNKSIGRLYHAKTDSLLSEFLYNPPYYDNVGVPVLWSGDNRWLTFMREDTLVRLDIQKGKVLRNDWIPNLKSAKHRCHATEISPDNKWICVYTSEFRYYDDRVMINVEESLFQRTRFHRWLYGTSSPQFLASRFGGCYGIKEATMQQTRVVIPSYGLSDTASSIAWSPDSRYVASAANDLIIWNAADGKQISRLNEEYITHLQWSPDGKSIFTTDYFGSNARLVNVQTMKVLRSIATKPRVQQTSVFNANGSHLLSQTSATSFDIVRSSDGGVEATYNSPVIIHDYSWTKTPSEIALACGDSVVRFWNFNNNIITDSVRLNAKALFALSNDNNIIAAVSNLSPNALCAFYDRRTAKKTEKPFTRLYGSVAKMWFTQKDNNLMFSYEDNRHGNSIVYQYSEQDTFRLEYYNSIDFAYHSIYEAWSNHFESHEFVNDSIIVRNKNLDTISIYSFQGQISGIYPSRFDPIRAVRWSSDAKHIAFANSLNIYIWTPTLKDTSVSVEEQETIPPVSLTLFPNPAGERLTIRSEHTIRRVHIANTIGRVISSCTNGDKSAQIDIRNLSPGMYSLIAEDEQGRIETKPFVILR